LLLPILYLFYLISLLLAADTSFTVQDRLEYTRLGEFVAANPELVSFFKEKSSVNTDIPDKYLQPVGTVSCYVDIYLHETMACIQVKVTF